jgi:hypothetical protein
VMHRLGIAPQDESARNRPSAQRTPKRTPNELRRV